MSDIDAKIQRPIVLAICLSDSEVAALLWALDKAAAITFRNGKPPMALRVPHLTHRIVVALAHASATAVLECVK